MTLRQKLACVGLTVFGLQIASAAAGGAPLADRLYVMEHGRIVESFDAKAIDEKMPVLNELLGV